MKRAIGLILSGALVAGLGAGASAAEPSGVVFQQRGDGAVLATPVGMTLYTFARDQEPGKSACNEGCAKVWPPYLATGDAKAQGDWSLVKRADGSLQWAYRDKPLYAYSKDVAAGDTFGEEVNGQWHLAFKAIFTPPEIAVTKTLIGSALANSAGMALYTSDKDKPNESACNDACVRTWRPVSAPWSARATGDWSIVARKDGTRQWAHKGKPLYAYALEAKAGATLGDGVDKTWHAAIVQPPSPMPAWVKIHQSDAGELFTDAQGRTLYQRVVRPRAAGGENIEMGLTSDDAPKAFHPVTVASAEDAKPVGNWSIVDQGGNKQWAYKGLPLYTNELDVAPGDLKGFRGSDRSFHTIMRSGEPMQGTGQ